MTSMTLFGPSTTARTLSAHAQTKILHCTTDQDYTIFVWRQQQLLHPAAAATTSGPSTSGSHDPQTHPATPTLHLHDPAEPLPAPPQYMNPSYYIFQPSRVQHTHPGHRA